MLLEKINGPADLKKFNASERQELAKEMRAALLKRASIHGGHFGPDFGMVDKIMAYLIQVHKGTKTSNPYEIRASRSLCCCGGAA